MRRMITTLGIFVFTLSALAAGIKFKQHQFQFEAAVDERFQVNLRDLLSDSGSGSLIWTQIHVPSWLTLDTANERIYGTPRSHDAGTHSFRLAVQDASADGGAVAAIEVKVVGKPGWNQNPLDLGTIIEGKAFATDLRRYVVYGGKDTPSFDGVSLPAWLSLTSSGVLEGVPERKDVGAFNFEATVHTDQGEASVKVFGEVVKVVPSSVKFLQDEFHFSAKVNQPFSLNLVTLVKGPLPSQCKFAVGSLPAFLSMNTARDSIEGTPPVSVGAQEFTVRLFLVCDDEGAAAMLHLDVEEAGSFPSFKIKEREIYQGQLPLPAAYRWGDPKYTFRLLKNSNWLTVFPNGDFEARPLFENIGIHEFLYEVANEQGVTTEGKFLIHVLRDPRPPVWLEDPIHVRVRVGETLTLDLGTKVKDLDGVPVHYRVLLTQPWIQLSSGGILEMSPKNENVGTHRIRVIAANDVGEASAVLVVGVEPVPAAPVWSQDPIQLSDAKAGQAYAATVSRFASDPNGTLLTFSKLSGPQWLTVSAEGTLSGTPGSGNLGVNVFQINSKNGDGLSSTVTVKLKVIKANRPPQWTQDPLKLPPALEDHAYCVDLGKLAQDADGDPLTFMAESFPNWLTLTPNGRLCGTPTHGDVGLSRFFVIVSDGLNSTTAGASLTVLPVNHPPIWTMNPITITVPVGQKLSMDLAPYVRDPDGDPLVFSAPPLAGIEMNGSQLGIVAPSEPGAMEVVVTVVDSSGSAARTLVKIRFMHANVIPKWSVSPVKFKAQVNTFLEGDLSKFVVDPDVGDVLSFSLLSGPSWLMLSTTGRILGIPEQSHVGESHFRVRVLDSAGSFSDGEVVVEVSSGGVAPKWKQNPVDLGVFLVDTPKMVDLSAHVVDEDGDVLRFKLLRAPAWLQISKDGKILGGAGAGDLGAFTAEVEVSDGMFSARVQVFGRVR